MGRPMGARGDGANHGLKVATAVVRQGPPLALQLPQQPTKWHARLRPDDPVYLGIGPKFQSFDVTADPSEDTVEPMGTHDLAAARHARSAVRSRSSNHSNRATGTHGRIDLLNQFSEVSRMGNPCRFQGAEAKSLLQRLGDFCTAVLHR